MEENERSTKKQKTSQVTENVNSTTEDEFEEGEFYVSVELPEYENSNMFQTMKTYSAIGLDTPTPFFQLDDKIYQGEFEETVGTKLFFETIIKENTDANAKPEIQDVKYHAMATKKLKLKRVFLEQKKVKKSKKSKKNAQ